MAINFVNLTPHDVVIYKGDVVDRTIPFTGIIARAKEETKKVGELDGIPETESTFGEVENLPEPQPNTIYIVSALAAKAARDAGRTVDLRVPHDSVRNDKGQIIGCRSLGRIDKI